MISELVDQTRQLLSTFRTQYQQNIKIIEECEAELLDLQHKVEFYSYDASTGYAIYKRQQAILRKRRAAKDENESLGEMVTLLDKYPRLADELNRTLGSIRNIEQKQTQRVYRSRVTGKYYRSSSKEEAI